MRNVSGKTKMLYAPSNNWTCHFPAVAIILTVCLCYFFGISMLILIIPFLCFYSLLIYLGNRDKAIRILVDQDKLFVRRGLDSEIEYDLHEVSSFVVSPNRFRSIFEIKPWEWILPNPYKPVRLIMLMANGSEKLLFSYGEASPFKFNWSNFAKKLEHQTGKTIELKENEQFDL
jgi:hypothetical protein